MTGEEERGTEIRGSTRCVSPWWGGRRVSPGAAQGPGG